MKILGREKKEAKKILQRMITNFKSDYGNLLLSGLATTELNIPWQIKSGSRKFLRFTRLLGLEDERQPEKD
jgi:hypothetical protein